MQFMPATWEYYSNQVFGEVKEMTQINEKYVAVKKIDQWLRDGYDEGDIALIWNQGNAGKCSSGVNRHGVRYNSCAYKNAVLAMLHETNTN